MFPHLIYRNESNHPSLAKLGFISCRDSPLHHLLLNNIKQFKIPFSIPYNHSYNTWVLRRFPRKTVNSQTDSDAAYTFRACINKSAREFQKEKSVYFTCMLSTTILK